MLTNYGTPKKQSAQQSSGHLTFAVATVLNCQTETSSIMNNMTTSTLLSVGVTKLNLSKGVSEHDGGAQVLADVDIVLVNEVSWIPLASLPLELGWNPTNAGTSFHLFARGTLWSGGGR